MTDEEACEQRRRDFMVDLINLLKKHDAELDTELEFAGGYNSYKAVLTVYFNGQYDPDGNTIKPYTDLALPASVTAKTPPPEGCASVTNAT
jgi:hypothetical protein